MTKEEKQLIFSPMLKDFETEEMKAYFMDMVAEIPDYIFTMPSSTSGKYHNATQCLKHGQIFHIYMFSIILNHRLRLEWNQDRYCEPKFRDAMRCIPAFHDAVKCGWDGSKYTVANHPMLAAEWVRNTKVEHDIEYPVKEFIACCCEAHSGEWNTDRYKKVIMPKPRSEAEFFIHECDILASRKDLDMSIPKDLKDALAKVFVNKEDEAKVDPNKYIFDFGKYKGKTLKEVNDIDFSYVTWLKENYKKEPLKTYLKEF